MISVKKNIYNLLNIRQFFKGYSIAYFLVTFMQILFFFKSTAFFVFIFYIVPQTRERMLFWALLALFHCMVRFGTVHFWGVFHWVLYLVPGTFLVPPRPGFQAIRTVTKT